MMGSAVAMLAVLTAVALMLRAPSFTVSVIDWDESVYVLMAEAWRHGGLPYLAVWDQHPVGLPALLAVSAGLTGDAMLSGRLAASLAVALTAWLLGRITIRWLSDAPAGWLVALLYLLATCRADSLPAQTEVFNNALVTLAAFLLLGRPDSPARTWRSLAAGLAFGAALQVKYVVVPEAVLLSLGYLGLLAGRGVPVRRLLLHALLLIAGGVLPTGLAMMYFWQHGALGPFLQANIGANLAYVALVPGAARTVDLIWTGLKPIGALLLAAALLPVAARGLRDPAARILLGTIALWTLAAALDVCLPLKFWRHYFQALLPPLCLAAGALGVALSHRAPPPARRWVLAGAFALLALPAIRGSIIDARLLAARAAHDVPRLVAAEILRRGTDGHDVYVFNYQPVIYHLTATRPPTRFVMPSELSAFRASSGADAPAVVDSILATRPRWIVAADGGATPFAADLHDMLAGALRDYERVGMWTDSTADGQRVSLYMRRAG